jgi:hypothetical protein
MKTQNLFSMVLNITYFCQDLNSEIIITGVSGNQAQGTFTLNHISIPVTAYRHPDKPGTQGAINIWFAGADINPNEFVGGTGRYAVPDSVTGLPESILLGGAYPMENTIATFSGTYLRQD